jgi:glycosyltransferase involved in cell wall biosynthesis
MRIATLANAAAIHTRRWVQCFRDFGHEVEVWSLENGPESLGAHRLPRVPLPGVARYPLAVGALRQALEDYKPDLVDAHYVPNYGLMAALAGRHPFAVTAWGSDLLIAGPRDALQRARAHYVLSRADLVLADAENLAAAARVLGAPADRTHAIPWGVELRRFENPPPREPGLVFTSRMHEPLYDVGVVIEGVARAFERHRDLKLVVAGDGPERRRLERLAGSLLPVDRVLFTGLLSPPQIAAWLGRAEIYVSASRSDSTSISLLEAMAGGAIPLVTDLEGNREWVLDRDGARLFPVGDAEGLARAIDATLGDASWRDAARARNRAVIEARGSWDRNMRVIEQHFLRLAAGRRA